VGGGEPHDRDQADKHGECAVTLHTELRARSGGRGDKVRLEMGRSHAAAWAGWGGLAAGPATVLWCESCRVPLSCGKVSGAAPFLKRLEAEHSIQLPGSVSPSPRAPFLPKI
jgi:hypothetical protein